jgi:hypothetical protein
MDASVNKHYNQSMPYLHLSKKKDLKTTQAQPASPNDQTVYFELGLGNIGAKKVP